MADSSRVVLITGASRGIGAATAKLFGAKGYTVVINYRTDEDSARKVAGQVRENGSTCVLVQADVSKEANVVDMFKAVEEKLGRVNALVNNAGILLPQMSLVEMSAERINKMLTTNVTSHFLCAREAIKHMSTKRGGSGGAIVNVSSAAARLGSANEYIDYAASKGAIDTLTRGLALEVAKEGIRVNCVRPGFIDTQMHADGGEPGRIERLKNLIPMRRGGKPEEVANAIYWLASDDATYATGSFIDVAGGR